MKNIGESREIDLNEVIKKLLEFEPNICRVYLFGSRRYKTGSTRSDIDLLICTNNNRISNNLGLAAQEYEPYLDIFRVIGNLAISIMNESQISSDSQEELLVLLNAIELWNSSNGWVNDDDSFKRMSAINNIYPEPSNIMFRMIPDPYTDSNTPDYVIITTLNEEFQAAIDRIKINNDIEDKNDPFPHTWCTLKTKSNTKKIAICKASKMGNVASALITLRSIIAWHPKLIFLVGITAGIEDKVHLGDLIIPDQIVEYESTKLTDKGEQYHGSILETPHEPRNRVANFNNNLIDWLNDQKNDFPVRRRNQRPPKIHNGAMASGNKVISNSEYTKNLTDISRRINSIEMEAFGVASACGETRNLIPYIIIKSVSDYADKEKDDEWHSFCSSSSIDLVCNLIENDVFQNFGTVLQ